MTIKKTFYIDIYSCNVHVTAADDVRRSINYYLKKHGEKIIEYDVEGLFFVPIDQVSDYYLFFNLKGLDVNTLNHEISHLIEEILIHRHIKASGEQRAYLHGSTCERIYNFFKKKKCIK